MTEKDRERFLKLEIRHVLNRENNFSYEAARSWGNVAQFTVMPDEDYQGNNLDYAKVELHEFRHCIQREGGVNGGDVTAVGSILASGAGLVGGTVGGMIYAVGKIGHLKIDRRKLMKLFCTAGASLIAASLLCHFGPSNEEESDIFADLVMPEHALRPEAIPVPPVANGFEKIIDLYDEVFIDTHQPRDIRFKNSVRRCIENLEQQKQVNMPSFVAMLGY